MFLCFLCNYNNASLRCAEEIADSSCHIQFEGKHGTTQSLLDQKLPLICSVRLLFCFMCKSAAMCPHFISCL